MERTQAAAAAAAVWLESSAPEVQQGWGMKGPTVHACLRTAVGQLVMRSSLGKLGQCSS